MTPFIGCVLVDGERGRQRPALSLGREVPTVDVMNRSLKAACGTTAGGRVCWQHREWSAESGRGTTTLRSWLARRLGLCLVWQLAGSWSGTVLLAVVTLCDSLCIQGLVYSLHGCSDSTLEAVGRDVG